MWRLCRAGWRVRYASEVDIWHDHRVRLRDFVADRRRYARSLGPLARRHPGAAPAMRVSPGLALPWALMLAGRPRPRWSPRLDDRALPRQAAPAARGLGVPGGRSRRAPAWRAVWAPRVQGLGYAVRRAWAPPLVARRAPARASGAAPALPPSRSRSSRTPAPPETCAHCPPTPRCACWPSSSPSRARGRAACGRAPSARCCPRAGAIGERRRRGHRRRARDRRRHRDAPGGRRVERRRRRPLRRRPQVALRAGHRGGPRRSGGAGAASWRATAGSVARRRRGIARGHGAAVACAEREFGGLDAVIAVAGVIAGGVPLWEMPVAEQEAVIEGNLRSVLVAARVEFPRCCGAPSRARDASWPSPRRRRRGGCRCSPPTAPPRPA